MLRKKKTEIIFYNEKVQAFKKKIMLCAPSSPTLCDPMDCSLPGSSVHGIFQARILQWVAFSPSGESSQPRDRTCDFCISQADSQLCH